MYANKASKTSGLALTVLVLVAGVFPAHAPAQETDAQPLGIVVHPDTDIDNLTLDELRRIFLADRLYWPDNSRIVLLVRAPTAYERTFVLNHIYQMTEEEFRRYWVAKMFRAEIASGPRVVFSSNMALGLVTAIPGSISFMLASEIPADAKVVRIDGKLPSEEGYPLQ